MADPNVRPSAAATRPRVVLIIGYLNSGGAERAALNIASASTRFDCVVLAERAGGDLDSAPRPDVVFASPGQDTSDRLTRILRLIQTLRRIRPHAAVSM